MSDRAPRSRGFVALTLVSFATFASIAPPASEQSRPT
jgi:hypothetical protein